jgi:YVTN family beta-propeller protein
MAISPDGTRLYRTNQIAGSVTIFDTVNYTVLGEVRGIPSPIGIAISPDGKYAYVARQSTKTVKVINTATRQIVDSVPIEGNPAFIAFTPDGTAYVTTQAGSVTAVLARAGGGSTDPQSFVFSLLSLA